VKAPKVRPPARDPRPERTDKRHCTYDEPHGDYLYTQAFVDKVVRKNNTAPKYRAFIGREPRPKASNVTPLSAGPATTTPVASARAEATPA
jgi:hypothetical protein